MLRSALFACLLAAATIGAAEAQEVTECSRTEQDGARTLCHETIVDAPADAAWALFATTEGLSSWLAPVAAIDLRIGGIWEASYAADARLGDPGNIRNRVLSYVPGAMLSIAVDRAPPGFPQADLVGGLWTVIDFEPQGPTQTRVRVTMLGYRDGAGYDELYGFFNRGNAYTLNALRARIADGPTDWSAAPR